MPSRRGKQSTILNAKAAAGYGTPLDVADYQYIGLAIAGHDTADLTVKVQGSFLMSVDTALDFESAPDQANLWDYIAIDDLNDGMTRIAGDTGIVFSGDDVRLFKVNVDQLRTLNLQVSARTGGKVTAVAFPLQ